MLHARSTLSHETINWQSDCIVGSKQNCMVGFTCPDSTIYDDKLVDKNMFLDGGGKYCNCWRNPRIDDKWVPNLEVALQQLG